MVVLFAIVVLMAIELYIFQVILSHARSSHGQFPKKTAATMLRPNSIMATSPQLLLSKKMTHHSLHGIPRQPAMPSEVASRSVLHVRAVDGRIGNSGMGTRNHRLTAQESIRLRHLLLNYREPWVKPSETPMGIPRKFLAHRRYRTHSCFLRETASDKAIPKSSRPRTRILHHP